MIVEVCPVCGGSLQHLTYATYPPTNYVKCLECGWQHEESTKIEYVPYGFGAQRNSSPCDACPNNIANGGSGICHCILGNWTKW